MSRKIVRVVATLFFVGSVVIGGFATYVWLTPSDEQTLYDQKHQEAIEKLKKAEAAKGTPTEATLAKEATDAAASADAWGRGSRDRLASNRLAVIASGAVAFLSFIVLRLSFTRRKNTA